MSLQAQAKFQHELVHCPTDKEEHQCVGILDIWAYLHVTGTVQVQGALPGGGFGLVTQPIDDKILPQKIRIRFAVDFSNTIGSKTEVDSCQPPVGTHAGPSPKSYPEVIAGVNLTRDYSCPGLPYSNQDDSGLCLHGTAQFRWSSGVLQVVGSANGSAGATLPVVGLIGGSASGSASAAVAGQNFPLDVGWRICHGDGCQVTITPDPDTGIDAKQVYRTANGGNP